MSVSALDGVRTVLDDVIGVASTLGEQEWQRPSACAGWTVKDVMAHLAGAVDSLVNPIPRAPLTAEDDIEAANDVVVCRLKDRSPTEILAMHERGAPAALERLAAFENPTVGSARFSLGNAGAYPLSAAKDALCFDHMVHLHTDLLAPDGPLDRPAPEIDDLRMTPTIRWMVGGIPQMCGRQLAPTLVRPIAISLDGPGGRRFTMTADPHVPGEIHLVDDIDGPAATISSTAVEFMRWATLRAPWQKSVKITGDTDLATSVLANFRVF